jgi:hypothetical protein
MTKFAAVPFILAISLFLFGCGGRPARPALNWVGSCSTTWNGVTYTATGPMAEAVHLSNDDFLTMGFTDLKFIVRRNNVLVDDKAIAEIPAGAKSLQIDVKGKDVLIRADGKKIYQSKS